MSKWPFCPHLTTHDSCLVLLDSYWSHEYSLIIKNHVNVAFWISLWFTMIMHILLYHALILVNKNLTPASLVSTRMHLNLDENTSQGEELGVRPHLGCGHSTRGSTGSHPSQTWSWSYQWSVYCGYRRCYDTFLCSRGPLTYINHPMASILLTPSSKAFLSSPTRPL
jgi:hypothetical protein